jgi:sugar phosphate isomerase/epimerase
VRLCLAHLTVFDLMPPQVVEVAAKLRCESISILLTSMYTQTPCYSLIEDTALRRQTKALAVGAGVRIEIGEGLSPKPDSTVEEFERGLDVMAELGVSKWNFVDWVADPQQRLEQLATLTALAKQRGITPLLEFTPLSPVKTAQEAVAIVNQIEGLKVMVDPLHLFRGGDCVAHVLAIPPDKIGCAQLCDGPRTSESMEAYREEALTNRLPPGEGEFPLVDFVRALPQGLTLSPEAPLRRPGWSALKRARTVVDSTRRVLAEAGGGWREGRGDDETAL